MKIQRLLIAFAAIAFVVVTSPVARADTPKKDAATVKDSDSKADTKSDKSTADKQSSGKDWGKKIETKAPAEKKDQSKGTPPTK